MLNDVSLEFASSSISSCFGVSFLVQEPLCLSGIINSGIFEGRGCTIPVQKQQHNLMVM